MQPASRPATTPPPSLRFPPHEPPVTQYVSVGTSVLSHLKLMAAVAGVGLILGLLFGAVRPPIYTAEAQLIVGRGADLTNLAADAGLEPTEESLAVEYSRLIVVADSSRYTQRLGGALTASPIPSSTIIRVDATAASKSDAKALAAYGAKSLIDQVNSINNSNQAALNSLEASYGSTEAAIAQYNAAASTLQAEIATGGPNALSEETQLSQLEAKIDVAVVEANTEESQFEATDSPYNAASSVVQTTGPIVSTGSDRKEYLEIGLAAGLLGGALLGVAFAALVDIKPGLLRRSRRTRQSSP